MSAASISSSFAPSVDHSSTAISAALPRRMVRLVWMAVRP